MCIELLSAYNNNHKMQNAYADEKLTLFRERSRTDMPDERLRRVTKRSLAKVRPCWLSDNFNEHKDLVAAVA